MLNIHKDSIKVYKQSIFPAISFTVSDNRLEEDTIPVRIDGIVLSMDWKHIANIVQLPDNQVRNNPMVDGRIVTHGSKVKPRIISAVTDNSNNPAASKIKKSFKTYTCELLFTLNNRVLEHIERLRQEEKNNDVVLYFIFRVSYLKHSIKLGEYATKSIQEGSNGDDVSILSNTPSEEGNKNNNNFNLRVLVNEDKENKLLFYMVDEFRRQVIIPSN